MLGFFFLLRRSEYLFIGARYHSYILKRKDIIFLDSNHAPCRPRETVIVGIRLYGAKNNQYGREEIRYRHCTGHPILCPIRGARWVAKAAKALKTPLEMPALSLHSQKGITAHQMSQVIKAGVVACDLNPKRYSTHSIRIGGATALLNAGTDSLLIKLLGRWLSNCLEEYPVLTAKGTEGLSTKMIA